LRAAGVGGLGFFEAEFHKKLPILADDISKRTCYYYFSCPFLAGEVLADGKNISRKIFKVIAD
jgi:hypothetical protein